MKPPGDSVRRYTWLGIALLWGAVLVFGLSSQSGKSEALAYSDLKAAVAAGKVAEVVISPTEVRGRMKGEGGKEGTSFAVVRVDDPDLVRELGAAKVKVSGAVDRAPWWGSFVWLLPLGISLLVMMSILRRAGPAGQGGLFAVGRSRARVYVETDVKVTFADVAGVDEAMQELQEVIEFLKTPDKFRRLGGKIP